MEQERKCAMPQGIKQKKGGGEVLDRKEVSSRKTNMSLVCSFVPLILAISLTSCFLSVLEGWDHHKGVHLRATESTEWLSRFLHWLEGLGSS